LGDRPESPRTASRSKASGHNANIGSAAILHPSFGSRWSMSDRERFGGLTVQFYVTDSRAGVDFYTRVLGRPPNFAPLPDFHEWDDIVANVTFQIAEGPPRPTYPIRLKVDDIEAERARIVRDASPRWASPVKRFEGLVAVCDFVDPWGNTFGLYQVLFTGGEPPQLAGHNRDHRTEIEQRLAAGLGTMDCGR
jgi:catechol 2,3-dioxygenase-like lactoylglutathione lyase family enzyme